MLFKRKSPQLFYLPEPKRFMVTRLDKFVVTVVLVVYLWAFLIDSFRPILNVEGNPIMIITQRGLVTVPHINLQFFLAPFIYCYEMLVLVILDGKLKGRELPWGLYFWRLKIVARDKMYEGIKQYRDWRKYKKK